MECAKITIPYLYPRFASCDFLQGLAIFYQKQKKFIVSFFLLFQNIILKIIKYTLKITNNEQYAV